jgi:hypothetical protein
MNKRKRWRLNHPEARNAERRKYYSKSDNWCYNERSEWTLFEIDTILHPHKPTDVELSKMLGRSIRAIQIKRCKLKAKEKGEACLTK